MNAVVGQCYTSTDLNAYRNAGLRVIVFNVHSHPTVSKCAEEAEIDSSFDWPYIYARSTYRVWKAAENAFDDCNLWHDNRAVPMHDDGDYLLFRASDFMGTPPFSIEAGPDPRSCCYYQEFSWIPTIMEPLDNTHYYEVTMRIKLGEDRTPATIDTIARIYVDIDSLPNSCATKDEILQSDTVYVVDTTDAGFYFTPPLHYHFHEVDVCDDGSHQYPDDCYPCDQSCKTCKHLFKIANIGYHVDYYGNRDLSIDRVKLIDQFSPDLWEDSGETAKRHLKEFTNQYFDTSNTVLGWYIFDDQELCFNRNNMLSAKKVDSLLVELTGKPGFMCPASWATDVQSYYQGSTQFDFNYPVRHMHTTESRDIDKSVKSIQDAWEGGNYSYIKYLDINKRMSLARQVNYYVTLQGFEDRVATPQSSRRLTAEENLCMVNLALAYGVKGIFYWHLISTRFSGFLQGLNENSPPTPTWKQVDTLVGPWVEAIGPRLVAHNWLGACRWTDVRDSSFSFIDSLKSREFADDSMYAQVGFFGEDTSAARCLFLVNRRCLPSETQTMRLHLGDSEYPILPAASRQRRVLVDEVAGDTLIERWQNSNDFEVTVGPGAARLLRIETVPVGEISGSD